VDGEVEDYQIRIDPAATLDFGDAPDPTFPTRLASNGARHTVGPLMLGTKIDAEPDGQPDAAAQGDDANPAASDDEDGVVVIGAIVRGTNARVDVTSSQQALLQGFADWNHNGVWGAGEQIFTNQAVFPGVNMLTFPVPATAIPGPTFFRFRLSNSAGLGPAGILPTGATPNGEIEDYRFDVLAQSPSPVAPDEAARRVAAIDAAYADGKIIAVDRSSTIVERGIMLAADRERSFNRALTVLRARRVPRPRIDDAM
jgi:hypothetical protein